MDGISENAVRYPGWDTVGRLGAGSFGAVYEIQRTLFGRTEKAALKVITIPRDPGEVEELYSSGYDFQGVRTHYQDLLENIVREYQIMSVMKGNSNVVSCDDIQYFQTEDGIGWTIYIKMELLQPMMRALDQVADERQVCRCGEDLCRALSLCHSRNVIHRDIKPQNIFLSADGDFKLGDFGIAKVSNQVSMGTRVGTVSYMAPEVYAGQPYGHAADLYSLGLVLYWLLNERRLPLVDLPPRTPTAPEIQEACLKRLHGAQLPAPVHGSPELQRIVLRACAYYPADRYQSAEEMLRDLQRLNREPEPARPAQGPVAGETTLLNQEALPGYVGAAASGQKVYPGPGAFPGPEAAAAPAAVPDLPGSQRGGAAGAGRKPGKKWPFWTILAVLLLAAAGALLWMGREPEYSYDVTAPLLRVGEESLTVPEFNYFYAQTLLRYRGELRKGVPLSRQESLLGGKGSAEEELVELTAQRLRELLCVRALARSEGLSLGQEEQSILTERLAGVWTQAEAAGFRDADRYLAREYGEGSNMDSLERCLELELLCGQYLNGLKEDFRPDPEELRSAYEAEAESYELVCLSVCPADTAEAAELALQEMPETATYSVYNREKADAAFSGEATEWIFAPARQPGDAERFPDGNGGFWVIRFDSRDDAAHTLARAQRVSIPKEEGKQAEALSQSLRDGMSPEEFRAAAAALGYRDKEITATQDYPNAEVRSFLLDPSRKPGDVLFCEGSKAYYAVRFEESAWQLRLEAARDRLWESRWRQMLPERELQMDEALLRYAHTDLVP